MDMDRERQCAFACAVVEANSFHMFNANELKKGVNLWTWVWEFEMCSLLCGQHKGCWLFKTLTNFTLVEFSKLTALMVPIVVSHARFIGGHYNLKTTFKLNF